ncbi:MAG TPA: hypothetical protein VF040_13660 [Ktedonobacterales bacterium]
MGTSTIESRPVSDQRLREPAAEMAAVDAWKPLYLMAAGAALLSIALIAVAAVVYPFNPIPTTIEGWFSLYRDNWLLGLIAADLVMLVSYVLIGLIYFALYGALRRVNQPFMALATALEFVGMAAYFAANPAFSLLTLSNQYATATTGTERGALLAAGQAVIANWTGTAFNVAYFLSAIAAIIVSVVMLRGNVFGKPTAYTGLAMGVLTLVPASAGMVGAIVSFVALVPTVIWFILLARRFFQLGGASQRSVG